MNCVKFRGNAVVVVFFVTLLLLGTYTSVSTFSFQAYGKDEHPFSNNSGESAIDGSSNHLEEVIAAPSSVPSPLPSAIPSSALSSLGSVTKVNTDDDGSSSTNVDNLQVAANGKAITGKISVQLDTGQFGRDELPLKDIRVHIIAETENIVAPAQQQQAQERTSTCTPSALQDTTNDNGEYSIEIPLQSSAILKDAVLCFELSMIKDRNSQSNDPKQNHIFSIIHRDQTKFPAPVFVETVRTNLENTLRADFVFQATQSVSCPSNSTPFIFFNGQCLQIEGSSNDREVMKQQIDTSFSGNTERFPHLAALYYYTNAAINFGKDFLFLDPMHQLNFGLPALVTGYDEEADKPSQSNAFAGFGDSGLEVHLGSAYSSLADVTDTQSKLLKTEAMLDNGILHEMGHILDFEYRHKTTQKIDARIHPALTGVINEGCHKGYANIDSSCSVFEGLATFLSAAISHNSLVDGNHEHFKNNAGIYRVLLTEGTGQASLDPTRKHDLEVDEDPFPPTLKTKFIQNDHIAGYKLKDAAVAPFFEHRRHTEDYSVASLFWDLYDSNADATSYSPRETATIPLKELLPILLIGVPDEIITMDDLYVALLASRFVTGADIVTLFSRFGICVDSDITPVPPIGDGQCNPSEVTGLSAWDVIFPAIPLDIIFGYPNGRK